MFVGVFFGFVRFCVCWFPSVRECFRSKSFHSITWFVFSIIAQLCRQYKWVFEHDSTRLRYDIVRRCSRMMSLFCCVSQWMNEWMAACDKSILIKIHLRASTKVRQRQFLKQRVRFLFSTSVLTFLHCARLARNAIQSGVSTLSGITYFTSAPNICNPHVPHTHTSWCWSIVIWKWNGMH